MIKFIFVTLFIFVSVSCLFPQTDGPADLYGDLTITQTSDYYSLNYLSTVNAGKGFTGIASDGDILSASLNPASFKLNKKYQVFASYVFKNNVSYSPNHSINDVLKQNHPSASAGFGYKLNKDFQIGFSYRNDRNVDFQYEFTYTHDKGNYLFNQQTFSIPVTYDYKSVRFGTNLNLILFHGSSEGILSLPALPDGGYVTSKANTLKFVPDFGIKVSPYTTFSFGLSFTPGITLENEWTYSDPAFTNRTFTSRFPMKICAGVEFRTIDEKLKFTGDYRFTETSVIYGLKDGHNIHLGIDFKAEKNLSLRAGFFTLFEVQPNIIGEGEMDQYCLTLGSSYIYNNVSFHFSAITSSIIKNTVFSHSRLNLGITYDF